MTKIKIYAHKTARHIYDNRGTYGYLAGAVMSVSVIVIVSGGNDRRKK